MGCVRQIFIGIVSCGVFGFAGLSLAVGVYESQHPQLHLSQEKADRILAEVKDVVKGYQRSRADMLSWGIRDSDLEQINELIDQRINSKLPKSVRASVSNVSGRISGNVEYDGGNPDEVAMLGLGGGLFLGLIGAMGLIKLGRRRASRQPKSDVTQDVAKEGS